MFVGRDDEMAGMAAMLDAARHGRGAVVCLLGEAGVGKSVLLDAVHGSATDFLRLRTSGVESEFALAHACLMDVVRPLRTELDAIPAPQREALGQAVGWVRDGGAPAGDHRYLVSAATLSLLAAAAMRRPVLVLVDDVQWVDRESVAALLFAARRLRYDRVVLVMASREVPPGAPWDDIPRRRLAGLTAEQAHVLLDGAVSRPLITQLVALTGGSQLALVEVTRALTPQPRRGSAPLPEDLPIGERLTAAFGHLDELSPDARRVVLVAAAGPHEPRDRCRPVPQSQDGRAPRQQRAAQARPAVADRTRARILGGWLAHGGLSSRYHQLSQAHRREEP